MHVLFMNMKFMEDIKVYGMTNMHINDFVDSLKTIFGTSQKNTPVVSPIPEGNQPMGQNTIMYNGTPMTKSMLKDVIVKGLQNWGSPLIKDEQAINAFVEAPFKYPIFQKYPFLLPSITVNETGAGNKVTYPNNVMNWGIKEPSYQPTSPSQSIQSAMSGIGGRTEKQGFSPTQVQTSQTFQPFRQSGNLSDLSNVYAPSSDNPGTGGDQYASNLHRNMSVFENFIPKRQVSYK